MAKFKDLTPKLKSKLKTAEQEFNPEYTADLPFGQSVGGMSAFAQVFKRGYGYDVFGVDINGVWLGGSTYDSAIVQMTYDGTVYIWERDRNNSDNDLCRVVYGYQENGF